MVRLRRAHCCSAVILSYTLASLFSLLFNSVIYGCFMLKKLDYDFRTFFSISHQILKLVNFIELAVVLQWFYHMHGHPFSLFCSTMLSMDVLC